MNFKIVNRCLIAPVIFCLCCFSTFAAQPVVQIFTKQPQQGSMIVGRMLVDGDIYFKDKKLPLTETGEFVFGVGRESQEQVQLMIRSNNQTVKYPLYIEKRQWKIERVDGLAEEKVNPKSKETLARIKVEGEKVRQARSSATGQNAFLMEFVTPAKGRISGVYGSQRILNGEAKRPHFGLDIANKVGTSVVAPADGVVTLAERDLFFSGGTIIIDHGFGISTTYLHLNSIDVAVGQEITQNEKIATIGATGRANGPHLDWRLNWLTTRLDPQLLITE
ncbi:MAG: M23 family metallopeptidase [Deltaproteobacteria bacterium]|nr:M23 family metallopeptidase [Deltaproteobacteria bacterium]